MLQANEVARRFGAIEQAIGQAAQLCGGAQEMPMDLKDCLNQLDQQKSSVRQAIDSHDDARLGKTVERLKQRLQTAPIAPAAAAPSTTKRGLARCARAPPE